MSARDECPGQVIASLKIYKETGLKGSWIDLDGHFGNSKPDSYSFVSDLEQILPLEYQPDVMHPGMTSAC